MMKISNDEEVKLLSVRVSNAGTLQSACRPSLRYMYMYLSTKHRRRII